MATNPSFIEHVLEQSGLEGRLVGRKMFGEYGFHLDGKFVALACNNSLFVKASDAIENLGLSLPTRAPYRGAKPYPVADELLDDPDLLHRLLVATAELLPEPKPGKRKKR
ncbi:MAG: TfoX/Sxy family protein [Gammaproteobacteria bacterium]|jgi:TfoX/Sxy family transcriptional regulator of competence genes